MNEPLIIGRYASSTEAPSDDVERGFERPEVLRWTSGTPKAWGTCIDSGCILVALCLNQSLLTLAIDGEPFHDGVVDRGAALVIPAGSEIDARFATPSDFLHVHVPAHWLTE